MLTPKRESTAPTQNAEDGSITQEELERLLEEEQPNEGEITLDDTFDILRNSRRREVLVYLAGTDDDTATLSELAEHVAAKENDIDRDQLTSEQRKRVYIGLYQCHLPKMDDLGVVDYDQDRGTVALQNGPKLLSYLPDTEEETEDSRASLYGAVLVATLVTIGLTGIGPFAAVPAAAWAVVSTGALVAITLYDYSAGG
jgi:hypothetical protein